MGIDKEFQDGGSASRISYKFSMIGIGIFRLWKKKPRATRMTFEMIAGSDLSGRLEDIVSLFQIAQEELLNKLKCSFGQNTTP